MIDVLPAEVAIENYAQVAGVGGSWMEWDNRRHREAEDTAWPPPSPPEFPFHPSGEPWAEAFHFEGEEDLQTEHGGGRGHWQHDNPDAEENDPWSDFRNHWEEEEEEDDGGCECGGPPPPVFNLPPPPPIPRVLEEEEEGSGCDAPPPAETCPALLVAGDAHTHQRLHPPLAALVVAAATFTLVFIIAALVCWRYRRQRGRRGPSKSSSDLTNGIIYEDLPSGPTPRVVPAHAHPGDTHTLAPMELLDMKLTAQVPTTTYGGAESTNPSLLHQCQSPLALSPSYSSHGHVSPTFGHAPTPPPYSPKQPYDAHRSSRSSQELYNPTYEEISTGSDTTSVSSASVSSDGTEIPQPRERIMEGPGPPGGWSAPGTCTCSGSRRPSQGRRGVRGGRARKARASSSATSTGTTEGSEYHEALVSHLVPSHTMKATSAGVRHAALPYTIQGTSDGRTSTSSSSDLPVDRCVAPREPRYYVGIPPPVIRSPATPEGPGRGPPGLHFAGDSVEGSSGTSTCGGDRPSPTERGLPPLPSRSDRYRIYFTTDRRRGVEVAPLSSTTRTLDPSGRKRQKRHDATSALESEPLYHEL
ncbi:uncharacterized protein [Macrobrachium rosenbergii]|uniref:uncharacterized protein n=1 Tax=Macrobrachium rosenbergii TaxID=79674 RepID=UPI0034D77C8D